MSVSRHVFLACLFLFPLQLFSGEIKYPVSEIDSSLLRNADMVVRTLDITCEIKSLTQQEITTHFVITIFKPCAMEQAAEMVFYDNNSRVESFSGLMYNAEGKEIHRYKNDEIVDESAVSNGTLYSDDRVKIIRPLAVIYPFTIEYYIRQSIRKILFYSDWEPQLYYRESVESARLVIQSEYGLFPRVKTMNLPAGTTTESNQATYRMWEIHNLLAIEEEKLSPPLLEKVPVIFMEADRYAIRNFSGDFSSWKSYGAWIYAMNEGRDSLPAPMIQKIETLVEGESNPVGRMRMLYAYMQKNMRYVNVSLGIGGMQPEKSVTVAEKGYGDCKGLVLYMHALLKAVGIPSYYTLVRAGQGEPPIQEDFPGMQFNHVILCVPLKKDTTWLECTNPDQSFGFLGSFTDDRTVLLITPEGGVLTRTPVYGKKDNTLERHVRISLDSSGSATVLLTAVYRGLQFETMEPYLYLPPEKQDEELRKRFTFPGMRILSFGLTYEGTPIPEARLILTLSAKDLASRSGERLFVPIDKFIDHPGILNKDDSRKYDLCLKSQYSDMDSVFICIPPGYSVESKALSLDISTPFGNYHLSSRQTDSTIVVTRLMEKNKGRFPASGYNEYVDFLKQIARQDRSKVVLNYSVK
jgi:hypothetical protein